MEHSSFTAEASFVMPSDFLYENGGGSDGVQYILQL